MSLFSGKEHYDSDIVMGERYSDTQTGFEGVVTSISFFQFACERVALETYDETTKSVKVEIFDAPRLLSIKTGKRPEVTKTGGDRDRPGQRGSNAR